MAKRSSIGSAQAGYGMFPVEKPTVVAMPTKGYAGRETAAQKGVRAEEERVNGNLVEMLEKKLAGLQARLGSEENARKQAEASLAKVSAELESERGQLEDARFQISSLSGAEREVQVARHSEVELQRALKDAVAARDQAQRALRDLDGKYSQQRDEARCVETEWKEQIGKLVVNLQSSEGRVAKLQEELTAQTLEKDGLVKNAQELVLRYETECKQRLELEEKYLKLEERAQTKPGGPDAHQRLIEQLKSTQERCKRTEEQGREMRTRAEGAELAKQKLEEEVARLKTLCSQQSRKIAVLEQQRESGCPGRPDEDTMSEGPIRKSGTSSAPPAVGQAKIERSTQPASRIPPPVPKAGAVGQQRTAALPPGAIKRAGSVPARRQVMRMANEEPRNDARSYALAAGRSRSQGPEGSRPSTAGSVGGAELLSVPAASPPRPVITQQLANSQSSTARVKPVGTHQPPRPVLTQQVSKPVVTHQAIVRPAVAQQQQPTKPAIAQQPCNDDEYDHHDSASAGIPDNIPSDEDSSDEEITTMVARR